MGLKKEIESLEIKPIAKTLILNLIDTRIEQLKDDLDSMINDTTHFNSIEGYSIRNDLRLVKKMIKERLEK